MSLTILVSLSGYATKIFHPGGVVPHSIGKYLRHVSCPVASIDDLAHVLTALECEPRALVIRGELLPGIDPHGIVYRRKNDPDACFRDAPRRWLCLDIDNLPCPSGMSATSEDAVRYAVSHLPEEFSNASVFYQWSASAGQNSSKIKLHLWFWLEEPATDVDLRAWANHSNARAGFKLIDPALFNAVQVHYIARPIFRGVTDPVPVRSGLIHG